MFEQNVPPGFDPDIDVEGNRGRGRVMRQNQRRMVTWIVMLAVFCSAAGFAAGQIAPGRSLCHQADG